MLSDDAVRELCEGLRGNRTLRVLRLRNNDLTDAAAGHVRDLLLAGNIVSPTLSACLTVIRLQAVH